MVAGTGEGPPLAARLLERGWYVRVSVVSGTATRAYPSHPALEMQVGALGGAGAETGEAARAVQAQLRAAASQGRPCRWLIDASHPFALRISAALAEACRIEAQPLLRLLRPAADASDTVVAPSSAGANAPKVLADLADLARQPLADRRLLLAIGARRLAEAMAHCPGAIHHARLLPTPAALRQAMAAGIAPERVACLRPPAAADAAAAVEAALCRRWRIETVLCRRSGGPSERHWRRISAELGLGLLLLDRPQEPAGVPALELEALLELVGAPGGCQPHRL
ncbi:MAG: precorrin-6A/cobalt-precorrin-6A reductase [Synechococcaceae cyanobacterium]